MSPGAGIKAIAVALFLGLCMAGCAATGGGADSAHTAGAANIQLGSAYLQQGNLDVAKDKLERAVTQVPRDPTVHGLLAMLYLRLGDARRAETEYRSALSLAPRDPEQLNNYAVFLCGQGRVDEGVKRFQEAAKNPLYRTPWAAYTNSGVCLRGAKRDAEAEPLFARALAVRGDYAEAAVQLADLQLNLNRPADAYGGIVEFMRRNVASPDLLLLGWRAARAQSNPANSAQMAWRLQTEFPDSDQAREVATAASGKN